ncbi:hypothetical protein BVRB_8g185360 [Beta vulgaris subsp. vulgaris]|nr:hypothetical protein BVRB_8g185360 [Beta vulgaris subsp. vulgaris]
MNSFGLSLALMASCNGLQEHDSFLNRVIKLDVSCSCSCVVFVVVVFVFVVLVVVDVAATAVILTSKFGSRLGFSTFG